MCFFVFQNCTYIQVMRDGQCFECANKHIFSFSFCQQQLHTYIFSSRTLNFLHPLPARPIVNIPSAESATVRQTDRQTDRQTLQRLWDLMKSIFFGSKDPGRIKRNRQSIFRLVSSQVSCVEIPLQ